MKYGLVFNQIRGFPPLLPSLCFIATVLQRFEPDCNDDPVIKALAP